jgi:hypothetical protein
VGLDFWKTVISELASNCPVAVAAVLFVRQLISGLPRICTVYSDMSATWHRNRALRVLMNPKSKKRAIAAADRVLGYLDGRGAAGEVALESASKRRKSSARRRSRARRRRRARPTTPS